MEEEFLNEHEYTFLNAGLILSWKMLLLHCIRGD